MTPNPTMQKTKMHTNFFKASIGPTAIAKLTNREGATSNVAHPAETDSMVTPTAAERKRNNSADGGTTAKTSSTKITVRIPNIVVRANQRASRVHSDSKTLSTRL